jgi:hypothetical protein
MMNSAYKLTSIDSIMGNAYLPYFKTTCNMIQIENWIIFTSLIVAFFLILAYLLYFKIRTKLFPEVKEFQLEISPRQAINISVTEGSGILKETKIMLNHGKDFIVDITIDLVSYLLFRSTTAEGEITEETTQFFESKIDSKFSHNVTININNTSDEKVFAKGIVYFEIRKPLSVTVKKIFD